jgi:hypothetical protein
VKNHRILILLVSFVCALVAASKAQIHTPQDLAGWGWVQVYKTLDSNKYVSAQYELRLDNNCSTFQSSNFYFVGGINLNKNLNIEALYQFNSNYYKNLNTLYAGITYRIKLNKRFSCYVRTAYQFNQNHLFNAEYKTNPYSEWRNRVRLKYKLNKRISLTFSAEPTIHLNLIQHLTYLDKIRFVGQVSWQYNKYSSFTPFYMVQPQIQALKGTPGVNYMIGLTYQINLPKKWKKFDSIFKYDSKKKQNEPIPTEDLDQKIPVFNSQL